MQPGPHAIGRSGQGTGRRFAVVVGAVAVVAALLAPMAATAGQQAAARQQIDVVPVHDAYTSEQAPTETHNTERLSATSTPGEAKGAYLTFQVPALPAGATGVRAELRLTRDLHHLPESVAVSAVTDTSWTETTLTWRNAPARGRLLATVRPAQDPDGVAFRLPAAAVTGQGRYSFVVSSRVRDDVARFRSAEYPSDRPTLIVSYRVPGPPPPPPPGELSDVWIGAAASEPAPGGGIDYSVAVMNESNLESGPLRVRRSFDSSLPATFQQSLARDDAANGYQSFVSWKPPNNDWVGAAQGRYDTEVRAWAESVPTTGVYATAFHEPENDMTGPEFVAMQRHLYDVVKAANPTIHWGPVYMAYWWDDGTSHYIGDPDAWWPGNAYADFTAVDVYSNHGLALEVHPEFRGWYDYMRTTGEEMIIAEYGQYVVPPGQVADPVKLAQRAALIAQDAAWLAEQGTISMWLYWDAMGEKGDWRLNDPDTQRAWQDVAEAGRSR